MCSPRGSFIRGTMGASTWPVYECPCVFATWQSRLASLGSGAHIIKPSLSLRSSSVTLWTDLNWWYDQHSRKTHKSPHEEMGVAAAAPCIHRQQCACVLSVEKWPPVCMAIQWREGLISETEGFQRKPHKCFDLRCPLSM